MKSDNTYDADSEASSANEIGKETSELLQDRLRMTSGSSSTDEYEFVEEMQSENLKPKPTKTKSTR